jgi:hypothetical protein
MNDSPGGLYFEPGAGLFGPSMSDEFASNMKAYCEGRSTKGGYLFTIGGNKDSSAVGWQLPYGGLQTTYGIRIRPIFPVSNPVGPFYPQ